MYESYHIEPGWRQATVLTVQNESSCAEQTLTWHTICIHCYKYTGCYSWLASRG